MGAAAQTLIINGTNFVSTSTVTYNAVAHTATYVSSTELEIRLRASDLATAGTYPVVVTNPAPGGGASNSMNFTVGSPAPAITSLSPASATAGAAARTLIIKGTNFATTSTVTYNAVAHTATYVSSTELEITLSASDQATAGTYPVVVTNPAPGGGASNSVNFTVDNPPLAITSLSPASATVGAAAQTLIINGTEFRRHFDGHLQRGGPYRHLRELNRARNHLERNRPGHGRNIPRSGDQPCAGRRHVEFREFHRG